MLFSVLMPVYNTSKYLRQSIDSLLLQDFKDWELIIVDDGSTDESGKICDEYAKKYDNITVIHKENGGLFTARKTAIKSAKGEYSLFVDSDDFVEDNYFEKIQSAIDLYKPDILLFNYSAYFSNKDKKVKGKSIFSNNGISHSSAPRFYILHSHLMEQPYIYYPMISSSYISYNRVARILK